MKSTSADALLFEHQVCYPLYSAANAMVRAYRPELDQLGLTYLQYMVMLILWEKDGISVGDLGARLLLDSGTLTPLLKRLESKGMIARRVSDDDERKKCLILTAQGRELRQAASEVPGNVICRANVDLEQLLHLKQQCENLLQAMGKVSQGD